MSLNKAISQTKNRKPCQEPAKNQTQTAKNTQMEGDDHFDIDFIKLILSNFKMLLFSEENL